MPRSEGAFIVAAVLSVIVAFAINAWLFFQIKSYPVYVEAPCDATTNVCYIRDCTNTECPPNNLESYTIFEIAATHYSQCSDYTCLAECSSQKFECREFICEPTDEMICSSQSAQE